MLISSNHPIWARECEGESGREKTGLLAEIITGWQGSAAPHSLTGCKWWPLSHAVGESHAVHMAWFNAAIQTTGREHKSIIWPKTVQEKQVDPGEASQRRQLPPQSRCYQIERGKDTQGEGHRWKIMRYMKHKGVGEMERKTERWVLMISKEIFQWGKV